MKRTKSLRQYCQEKALRESQEARKPQSATSHRPSAQDQNGGHRSKRAGLKRKPLRKVSAARAKENAEYSRRRRDFLIENFSCQVRTAHCTHHATQVHHRDGREGSLLTDVSLFTATCPNCHNWIHQHPNQARELGFIAPRGA